MKISELLAQIPRGTITTIAGVGYLEGLPARDAPAGTPQGVVRRADGDLIVLDMWGHRIWRIDNDGILHAFAGDGVPGGRGDGGPGSDARFYNPHDLTQDKHGNLYLTDLGNHAVRRIDRESGVTWTRSPMRNFGITLPFPRPHLQNGGGNYPVPQVVPRLSWGTRRPGDDVRAFWI